MRKTKFFPGERYHIFARGNAKQTLFFDVNDRARLLFLILYFQSSESISNISRSVRAFNLHKMFNVSSKMVQSVVQNRNVSLAAFTLMPNHFHLILEEVTEGGISKYMHKVLMAYAKYFNEKYAKSGHVFQGPYRAVHIVSNKQLLHVSAYVHLNQSELSDSPEYAYGYDWSSCQDYVGENRWGDLLDQKIILEQFSTKEAYAHFLKTSGVKGKLKLSD
ncbi:MAG: transposase [Patescibacteria group bacterium]